MLSDRQTGDGLSPLSTYAELKKDLHAWLSLQITTCNKYTQESQTIVLQMREKLSSVPIQARTNDKRDYYHCRNSNRQLKSKPRN